MLRGFGVRLAGTFALVTFALIGLSRVLLHRHGGECGCYGTRRTGRFELRTIGNTVARISRAKSIDAKLLAILHLPCSLVNGILTSGAPFLGLEYTRLILDTDWDICDLSMCIAKMKYPIFSH